MNEAYSCNHDVAAWHDREVCECGTPILTDEQVRQLMVIRDQYNSEPSVDEQNMDESVDAGVRDLDYFDQIIEVLNARGTEDAN